MKSEGPQELQQKKRRGRVQGTNPGKIPRVKGLAMTRNEPRSWEVVIRILKPCPTGATEAQSGRRNEGIRNNEFITQLSIG